MDSSERRRPRVLIAGSGEPRLDALSAALSRRGVVPICIEGPPSAAIASERPNLVLLVGDASQDGGARGIEDARRAGSTPVVVATDAEPLDLRLAPFQFGAVGVVIRRADAEQMAGEIQHLLGENARRLAEALPDANPATLDALVGLGSPDLRSSPTPHEGISRASIPMSRRDTRPAPEVSSRVEPVEKPTSDQTLQVNGTSGPDSIEAGAHAMLSDWNEELETRQQDKVELARWRRISASERPEAAVSDPALPPSSSTRTLESHSFPSAERSGEATVVGNLADLLEADRRAFANEQEENTRVNPDPRAPWRDAAVVSELDRTTASPQTLEERERQEKSEGAAALPPNAPTREVSPIERVTAPSRTSLSMIRAVAPLIGVLACLGLLALRELSRRRSTSQPSVSSSHEEVAPDRNEFPSDRAASAILAADAARPVEVHPQENAAGNVDSIEAAASTQDPRELSDELLRQALALRNRDPDHARDLLLQATEADENNARAWSEAARLTLASDAVAALDMARRAVSLRRRRADFRVLLGDVLEANGHHQESQEEYRVALELDPENEVVRARLEQD